MNDLTFAATLLSFFATVAIAVVVETTAAPARNANVHGVPLARPGAVHLARADDHDCTSVAQAPTVAP